MEHTDIGKARHTLAHLLAAAALEAVPGALLATGPATDTGFYYDIGFPREKALGEADFARLEKRMRELIKEGFEPECTEVSEEKAREIFKNQPYKLDLIDDIVAKGEPISVYRIGDFTDLCEGPHVSSTKDIDPEGFALTHVAGAYWKGDETKPMLTRIYGLAFSSKQELEEYQTMLEEAKKRDHKKLGRELDLFTFSDTVGKGLPLWTPKGSIVRRELEQFVVEEELKRGYMHVYTPDIAKLALYKKSGHYPHYQDSMYAPISIDDEEFMLRPMTCPHHFELYLRKPHSYRELPMRIAELAQLYRYEQSGELSGLQRVRTFCLADAHIICASEEQAVEEAGKALDLIEYIAGVFGLEQGTDYWYRLSLGDRSDTEEKYFKDDAAWDKGEDLLRKHLQNRGCSFEEAEGEAAFYGPKIDIQMRNVNGKEDTAFTVQYDFCMPNNFDLTYIAEDGTEKRAFVIHRSSIGAIERILAFLIEHYAGAFPLWLAPEQVRVLPIGEAHLEYAKSVERALLEKGFRVSLDESGDTLGKKIREGKTQKIPYLLVVGDKEKEASAVGVESRDEGSLGALPLSNFVERATKERDTRALGKRH